MLKPKVLKKFQFVIVVRVVLITCTSLLISFLWSNAYLSGAIIFAALLILQGLYLIRYLRKTNSDVAMIISAIANGDFTAGVSDSGRGGSYTDLEKALTEVLDGFKKIRNEKEENSRFMQTIIQHVGVGLLAHTPTGKIEFINNAARKILQVPGIPDITALTRNCPDAGKAILEVKPGERKVIGTVVKNERLQLLVYTTELRMRDESYILIAFQNIISALEDQEMEAWQKLIRVLTHEIMNSITPISSLSGTMKNMIEKSDSGDAISGEALEDFALAVNSIKNRSEGLIKFVENYRSLVKTPVPDFKIIEVRELFGMAAKLMESKLKENKISLEVNINPTTLELTGDQEMIAQILINLFQNAIHALTGVVNPRITLSAYLEERGKVVLTVADNGAGIEPEAIEKIFIPFFTTKSDGSGIGLSLSRQIMRAHGGTIRVQSTPGNGAIFTLRF